MVGRRSSSSTRRSASLLIESSSVASSFWRECAASRLDGRGPFTRCLRIVCEIPHAAAAALRDRYWPASYAARAWVTRMPFGRKGSGGRTSFDGVCSSFNRSSSCSSCSSLSRSFHSPASSRSNTWLAISMALHGDLFAISTLTRLSVLFSPFFFFLLRSALTGITTDNPLCCVAGLDRVTLERVAVALGRD